MKTVKGSASADKTLGITPGKIYSITYKGKDETEVINDFGKKECYSDDYFIQQSKDQISIEDIYIEIEAIFMDYESDYDRRLNTYKVLNEMLPKWEGNKNQI